jgi:hypothetical protein
MESYMEKIHSRHVTMHEILSILSRYFFLQVHINQVPCIRHMFYWIICIPSFSSNKLLFHIYSYYIQPNLIYCWHYDLVESWTGLHERSNKHWLFSWNGKTNIGLSLIRRGKITRPTPRNIGFSLISRGKIQQAGIINIERRGKQKREPQRRALSMVCALNEHHIPQKLN